MEQQKAIKLLIEQKNNLGSFMTFTWYNRTALIIEQIFGKESNHYKEIALSESMDVRKGNYDNLMQRLRNHLDACINDINDGLLMYSDNNSFDNYRNEKLTKGEKIHKVLEAIMSIGKDILLTDEIAIETRFNVSECNSICKFLILNRDLEEIKSDDSYRNGQMEILTKVPETKDAFITKKYLIDSKVLTRPFQHVSNVSNTYYAPVTQTQGNNSPIAGRDNLKKKVNNNKPDQEGLTIAKKNLSVETISLYMGILTIVIAILIAILENNKVWPFH